MEKKYFTCIGRGHGAPAVPATREDWEQMRSAEWLKDMCDKIEAGDETLKAKLPVWTPRCAEFRDNHRAAVDALKPLDRMVFDIDEKGHTDEIEKLMVERDGGRWIDIFKVLLLEESVRRGTHVCVKLPVGMTPQKAQERFSKVIGMAVDPAVKNVAGCIYMVSERHTKYIDEEFFEEINNEQLIINMPSGESSSHTDVTTPLPRAGKGLGKGAVAFDLCVQQAGLDPAKMDVWGEMNWHNNLMAVLSVGLPKLMSKEQLKAVVAEKLPNYSQFEDCNTLIDSFYDNYQAGKGYMSATLREINAKAQREAPKDKQEASLDSQEDKDLAALSDGYNPPVPPKKLTRVHQLITKNFDPRFTPMLLLASIPEMSAHASHYKGLYINGKVTGCQDYVAVIGASGKGKGNASDLHALLTEKTLQDNDNKELEKLRINSDERAKKTNAKDVPTKYHPKLRIIETVSSTSILDLQNNLGKNGMLLGHFSEADAFGVGGGTSQKLLSSLIRKGWSGEMHTQYYVSDSSCNVMVRMCMSMLVCGTVNSIVGGILSGKNTENGLMQRFIPVVMPKAKRTFRPPVSNRLTDDEKDELQGMMVRLYTQDLALGESELTLDMPQTRKAIEKWYDDLEERYNNGEVTEAEADLSARVGEHMMRAAIPLVALEGMESKEMLEFVKWVGDIAFYNLCWIFGHSVQKNLDEANEIMGSHQDLRKTAGPLLERLPKVFTIRQMQEVRLEAGQSENCRMLLKRYVDAGKLKHIGRGVYEKVM